MSTVKTATEIPLSDQRKRTAARRHLSRVDERLAPWIARVGACTIGLQPEGTHFAYLVRCIVYQQLTGRAAATIHQRVVDAHGGTPPSAEWLLDVPDDTLRAAGLSRPKISAVKDLARRTLHDGLPVEQVHELDSPDVIRTLTQVKGIGEWTAQMFLMFRLGRPDVLPVLDLGVRKGMQRVYRLRDLPSPERMEKIAAPWAPWRSVGAWYMWQVLELP